MYAPYASLKSVEEFCNKNNQVDNVLWPKRYHGNTNLVTILSRRNQ